MKEIHLTQGKVALVDDADFELVSRYTWQAGRRVSAGTESWYAVTTTSRNSEGKCKGFYMHRLIMGVTDPKIDVDHENHDGLDNQRGNLRVCDKTGNARNMRVWAVPKYSVYKGVTFQKRDARWYSRIGLAGRSVHLGSFQSEREAALAYNRKAIELFGEFASLNVLEQAAA